MNDKELKAISMDITEFLGTLLDPTLYRINEYIKHS